MDQQSTRTDITVIFWSVRAIMDTTRGEAPDAWRRHLELLISGLRPQSGPFATELRTRAMSEAAAQRITGAEQRR